MSCRGSGDLPVTLVRFKEEKSPTFGWLREAPHLRHGGTRHRQVSGHLFRSEPRTIGSRDLVRQFGSLAFGFDVDLGFPPSSPLPRGTSGESLPTDGWALVHAKRILGCAMLCRISWCAQRASRRARAMGRVDFGGVLPGSGVG